MRLPSSSATSRSVSSGLPVSLPDFFDRMSSPRTVAPHGIAMASPIITFSLTVNSSGVPCSVCLLLMASAVTTWIGVSSRTVIGASATAVGPGLEECCADPATEGDS